jgi:5-methylcytosine-specific restriction endonuclease McrA
MSRPQIGYKLASQAISWYNRGRKYGVSWQYLQYPTTDNKDWSLTMSDIILQDVPQKRCSACKRFLPATNDFFHRASTRKYGLNCYCKQCCSEQHQSIERQKRVHAYRQRDDVKEKDRLAQRERRKLPEVKERQRIRDEARRADPEYRAKEQMRSRMRYYQPGGKEKALAKVHVRRARKVQVGGDYDAADIKRLFSQQKRKCYYCKKKLGVNRRSYHIDHIVPLSRGGSNDISNLVVACPSCNLKKGNKLPHEWPEGGRLL